MKKYLSTSIYTFRDIINENCMYVDKTKDIFNLILKPKGQYFFSRPRRFGKSLTISTLESIFLGEKELFKGLYIYEQDYDWKKYPIIQIALNNLSSGTAEELEENIVFALRKIAKRNKIKLISSRSYQIFQELIEELSYENGKVVILIDEYDKPILDNILNLEEAEKIRQVLKKFYGQIKACEEYIRFSFITGVSKFTQVSVFSDLNNLDDISMDVNYATMCGFTQEECEKYFAEWINENAEKNKMSKGQYLEKLKEVYNGSRFSEKNVTVYNPVSFTKAMEHGKFKHYWFETGTPTFLLKLLKKYDYFIPNFESIQLKASSFSSYEIDRLRVEPLLYQTGYLTIKDYQLDGDLYTLSYPNREVKEAFVEYLSDYFTPVEREKAPVLIDHLRSALLANNLEEVFEILQIFYAKIDYDIKLQHEKYYQTIFYILFTLLGFRIKVEVSTNKGRMDAVVKTENYIYILEFKLNKSPEIAIAQIKEKEYYQKYLLDKRELILIGVNFTSKTGEIENWKVEEKRKS